MRRIIFAFLVMVVGCTSVEEKGLSRPSLSISDAINRDVFVDSVKFQLIKTPEKGLQITESWIEKTKQCALAPGRVADVLDGICVLDCVLELKKAPTSVDVSA